MTFTATPGDGNASPQQFIPAFGANANRYSQVFSTTIVLSGTISSIHNNIFNQISTIAFRALSRVTNFITEQRP